MDICSRGGEVNPCQHACMLKSAKPGIQELLETYPIHLVAFFPAYPQESCLTSKTPYHTTTRVFQKAKERKGELLLFSSYLCCYWMQQFLGSIMINCHSVLLTMHFRESRKKCCTSSGSCSSRHSWDEASSEEAAEEKTFTLPLTEPDGKTPVGQRRQRNT